MKILSRFLALSSALLMGVTNTFAEDVNWWSVDAGAAVYNQYMFRGFNLSDGASIQPSLNLNAKSEEYGTLSAGFWMHLPGESKSYKGKFEELDNTLKYSYAFEDATLSVGNIWYTYPNHSDHIKSTEEVFASLAFNAPLNPVLSVYEDYKVYDAQYYELGFSHTFSGFCGGSEASVTPFATFGFGTNSKKVYADNGLEQVTVGTSMAIPLGALVLGPSINYTFKVDDLTVNQLWIGTGLTYSF